MPGYEHLNMLLILQVDHEGENYNQLVSSDRAALL